MGIRNSSRSREAAAISNNAVKVPDSIYGDKKTRLEQKESKSRPRQKLEKICAKKMQKKGEKFETRSRPSSPRWDKQEDRHEGRLLIIRNNFIIIGG